MGKILSSKKGKIIIFIIILLLLISYKTYKFYNKRFFLSFHACFSAYKVDKIIMTENGKVTEIKDIPRNIYTNYEDNNLITYLDSYLVQKAYFYKNKPQNNIFISLVEYPYEFNDDHEKAWNVCVYEDGYIYIENLTDKEFKTGYYKISDITTENYYKLIMDACKEIKMIMQQKQK